MGTRPRPSFEVPAGSKEMNSITAADMRRHINLLRPVNILKMPLISKGYEGSERKILMICFATRYLGAAKVCVPPSHDTDGLGVLYLACLNLREGSKPIQEHNP